MLLKMLLALYQGVEPDGETALPTGSLAQTQAPY